MIEPHIIIGCILMALLGYFTGKIIELIVLMFNAWKENRENKREKQKHLERDIKSSLKNLECNVGNAFTQIYKLENSKVGKPYICNLESELRKSIKNEVKGIQGLAKRVIALEKRDIKKMMEGYVDHAMKDLRGGK